MAASPLSKEVKTATATVTTSAAGSFSIPSSQLPSDFYGVIGIMGNTVSGHSYIVQYDRNTFGVFNYITPHNPYVGELTITYAYI